VPDGHDIEKPTLTCTQQPIASVRFPPVPASMVSEDVAGVVASGFPDQAQTPDRGWFSLGGQAFARNWLTEKGITPYAPPGLDKSKTFATR